MMAPPIRPGLLVLCDLFAEDFAEFEKHFDVISRPRADVETIRSLAAGVQGVLTIGAIGLSREAMEALPDLRIVLNLGAGHERVDVVAASEMGIRVTTGGGLNSETVADHAMGLLLSVIREIPRADRTLREGDWSGARTRMTTLSGMTVGILGLGDIGLAVARRAEAFGTTILYTNRKPRPDVAYRFVPDLHELAAASDALIVSCPGGPATFHLVDAGVMEALGPDGYLVNVSRGSVVDTRDLIAALQARTLKAAALDVFENEPDVPSALTQLPNVVLTPHVGGTSIPAISATVRRAISNFMAAINGGELSGQIA